ncbi:MAG: threonylcarbamoyl-AMP synthase [Clostridia bacterium]|nr:threonylcarbamoyl-AMP synthase [Clostridia bacterium]
MKTKIMTVSEEEVSDEMLTDAGDIILCGGLVAFPTETVYGLGGNALDPKASEKIYAAKGRPSDNPLIVHIACMEDLEKIVSDIPENAMRAAKAFWPGPLTMIFKKKDIVPYETTGGLDTVAVRMPVHKTALALIRTAGGFIAAPSANTSGKPSPTIARHVIEDLDGKIDMIIDGGAAVIGLESTIVDFSVETPVILRPGFISLQMFKEIVPDITMDAAFLNEGNPQVKPKAPGMKYRHYAPKGQLIIVEGKQEDVVSYINQCLKEQQNKGEKTGVIATNETYDFYQADLVENIGSRTDDEEIARHLYGILREFDEAGITYIYSEQFDTPRMGQAIMNRLIKAAGHCIIKL